MNDGFQPPKVTLRERDMPQRSPLIFWLLLTAMLCVDVVAFVWAAAGSDFGSIIFSALMLSQVSVVCIRSLLNSEASTWTRFSPVLTVVLAALVWGCFSQASFIGKVGQLRSVRIGIELANQTIHAGLLLTMLGLLKRTAFWRRRSNSTADWQFSVADILVAMLFVTLLGTGMRLSGWLDDLDWLGAAEIVCMGGSALLATSAVIVWCLGRMPWVLRSSVVLGVALGLAFTVSYLDRGLNASYFVIMATHFLIQAVILVTWFTCAPTLPTAREATS